MFITQDLSFIMNARKCNMPFQYRLQKILDFRIRKKEEQLLVVQRAQQAVNMAEENIRKNEAEIQATKDGLRTADPMMYETYDKYLNYLWEKAEELEQIRQKAQEQLDLEKEKLVRLEQAVKVLEKHKERHKEIYLEEEKAAELKQYSELGVTRFFRQKQEKLEQEEKEVLAELQKIEGENGY